MALTKCKVITYPTGEQIVEFGTVELPISCHEVVIEESPVPYHWHEELELILGLEGIATVGVGSYKIKLYPNQGIFINSKELHTVIGDKGCKIRSIVFHPRIVGGTVDSVFWTKYVRPIILNKKLSYSYFNLEKEWHHTIIEDIYKAWKYGVEEKDGYELFVRNHLSNVMYILSNNYDRNQIEPSEKEMREQERMKGMLHYIETNYKGEITVKDLADAVSISESECLRCFKNTIGLSPMKYLKQYRIQCATRLLITSSETASNIGSMVGIDDNSYFTKMFREIKGCSPLEYRKMKSSAVDK